MALFTLLFFNHLLLKGYKSDSKNVFFQLFHFSPLSPKGDLAIALKAPSGGDSSKKVTMVTHFMFVFISKLFLFFYYLHINVNQ